MIKLNRYILSLTFILMVFYYTGCVEEPTIPTVDRAFSEARVINLSQNVNNMRVFIDGAQPVPALNSLSTATMTDYFQLPSGKRRFAVVNEAGDTIFAKEIEITSYERTTVIFSGFYSPVLLDNTFGDFEVLEGAVYVESAPDPGTLQLYFVHAAIDTVSIPTYDIETEVTSGATVQDTVLTGLAYGEVVGLGDALPGNYAINFNNEENDSTEFSYATDFAAGYKYYLFLYGNSENIQILESQITPPPARSRD